MKKRMKYNININQLFLSQFEELDIKDMAIFDYIQVMCCSPNESIEKNRYKGATWINYDKLISDMPALRIQNRNSITPRITKLETAGLVEVYRQMINGHRRVFVKLTTKGFGVFISQEERVHSDEKRVRQTMQDNNTKYNNTIDNSDETSQNINKYINILKPLNEVAYTKWFSNKTQRANVKLLADKFTEKQTEELVKFILLNRGKNFFPSVTTPTQLVDSLPKIETFYKSNGYKKEVTQVLM